MYSLEESAFPCPVVVQKKLAKDPWSNPACKTWTRTNIAGGPRTRFDRLQVQQERRVTVPEVSLRDYSTGYRRDFLIHGSVRFPQPRTRAPCLAHFLLAGWLSTGLWALLATRCLEFAGWAPLHYMPFSPTVVALYLLLAGSPSHFLLLLPLTPVMAYISA